MKPNAPKPVTIQPLAPGFPPELVAVNAWLKATRPTLPCHVEGNWVWVQWGSRGADFRTVLRAAGFKESTVRPGWWFHVGHRWRPGDTVQLPNLNIAVQPFGPITELMKPGLRPTQGAQANLMGRAKGVRARCKNDRGEIIITVDWLVRDWDLVTALTEVLLARLENVQASTFTLKAWIVPPPKPPDFEARTQKDINAEALWKLSHSRQQAFAEIHLRDRTFESSREAAQSALCDVVHDSNTSLMDKARAELRALLHPGANLPDQVQKTTLGLLTEPALVIPAGFPGTLKELEAATGPTPTIHEVKIPRWRRTRRR